jgi:hypothetical protein
LQRRERARLPGPCYEGNAIYAALKAPLFHVIPQPRKAGI